VNPMLIRVLNSLPLAGGLFPNAYFVARREYRVRVRNRTFAVLTIGLAVVGLALTLLPLGINLIGGQKPVKVAVYSTASDLSVDPATTVQSVLNSLAGGSGTTGGSSAATGQRFSVTAVTDPAAAKEEVRHDKLEGLLTISRGTDGDLAFDAFTKASATDQNVALVRQAATSIAISDRLERAGVSATDRGRIFAPTDFTTTPADPNAARQNQADYVPSYILAYVFVILAFMAIQVYGNWVAASVAEEKSSRVMELLITAATPRQLLFGKVLGNGAAGLTQYGAVLLAALVGFLAQGALSDWARAQGLLEQTSSASVQGLTPPLVIGFGVFFILGFILYSILYAAAGSMASRQEDVQQIAVPLTFLGLGGYLLSFIALPLIEAQWVKVASWIPFVSSFLFPARIALSPPAPWEYLLSIGLLVVAIFGALWVAARIYAAGVLLYGQRPTMRAILRATLQGR
jgi:ABC-2 type transport system permease protein